MSLTSDEIAALEAAGGTADPVTRQRAVGVYLAKSGPSREQAGRLLVRGFLDQVSPSFHLIPRGDSMFGEADFTEAYLALAKGTENFSHADTRVHSIPAARLSHLALWPSRCCGRAVPGDRLALVRKPSAVAPRGRVGVQVSGGIGHMQRRCPVELGQDPAVRGMPEGG